MRKIILSMVAFLSLQLCANAQTVIQNNYDSPITTANGEKPAESSPSNGFVQGTDIGITFNTDQKMYGLKVLYDVSDLFYTGFGFVGGFGDFSSYQGNFYLGLGKRYLISKAFLVQAKVGGYIGYASHEEPSYDSKGRMTKNDKSEFAYGAEANIAAGVKLWTTKKGTSGFITVGYYMCAPKFKFNNLGDSGSWGIGITLIK